MTKTIQQNFGQAVIDTLTTFARNGIPIPNQLDTTWFDHIQEKSIRDALSETLYGARWIYKIGLALQVNNNELYAHVRSQVIDYISISETLLAEMIIHAINKNHLKGSQWEFSDIPRPGKVSVRKIAWSRFKSRRHAIARQSFKWYIVVSKEEGIIDSTLAGTLEKMRGHRNSVHITEKAMNSSVYTLGNSAESFKVMQETINQTKKWFNKNK